MNQENLNNNIDLEDIEFSKNKNNLGIGSFEGFVFWCIQFSNRKYMEWDDSIYKIPKINLELVGNIKDIA